jgi:hypothetical protein
MFRIRLREHADERIDEYLSHLDRVDQTESEGSATRAATLEAKIASMRERRAGHAAMLVELEASGESQISLTDPDARGMATHPKVGVGYNAQVAIDAKHKLIVEQHVTNAGSDLGLLAQTAGAAKELLGVEQIDAVANMGYYKGEDIEACEAAGITPYVARPQRGAAVFEGRFARHEFVYDATDDFYRCPAGHRLDPVRQSKRNGHRSIHYSNRGYDANRLRTTLREQGTIPVIPGRRNRKRPIQYDKRRYKDRWRVEAMFCRLKDFRRVATRYDKLARNYQSAITLAAAIAFWL